MNEADTRAAIVRTLRETAPEIDPAMLDPDVLLREQVDLDSMDWLNFILALGEKFGVEIAEVDYARLLTINDFLRYVEHAAVHG
jgi:acyl carrier protein